MGNYDKKSVLFVFYKPIIPNNGGVQKVSFVLNKYFNSKGINSFYLSLPSEFVKESNSNQFFLPNTKWITDENISFLKKLIEDKKINIIINQMAYFKEVIDFIKISTNNYNVKIFTVSHVDPNMNWNNYYETHYNVFRKYKLNYFSFLFNSFIFQKLAKFYLKNKYKSYYNHTIKNSDKFVLLSDTYVEDLKKVIDPNLINKMSFIGNPLPFVNNKVSELGKNVIFVGRLSINQKRIDLLLKIWKKIIIDDKNWRLIIIGDGDDYNFVKKIIEDNNLMNVELVGHQNPEIFYNKSSIILSTSSFEGLPMSIIEALSFGLCAISFNSYTAINDLIIDNENGYIIKNMDLNMFSSKLSILMNNEEQIRNFSKKSLEISHNFNIDIIGEKWLNLFEYE